VGSARGSGRDRGSAWGRGRGSAWGQGWGRSSAARLRKVPYGVGPRRFGRGLLTYRGCNPGASPPIRRPPNRESSVSMTASSPAIESVKAALRHAFAIRPKVGGFPVLAEVLRQAGVRKNIWDLPSAQSIYLTELGPIVQQGTPLLAGLATVAAFDEPAVIRAIRADQAGETSFPQFLQGIWDAGVVHYEVDFTARIVTYSGVAGERYVEAYPAAPL
jgi:uncharacterized protein YbcV (DUF1398 family)